MYASWLCGIAREGHRKWLSCPMAVGAAWGGCHWSCGPPMQSLRDDITLARLVVLLICPKFKAEYGYSFCVLSE